MLLEAACVLLPHGKIRYFISSFHILIEVLRLMERCAVCMWIINLGNNADSKVSDAPGMSVNYLSKIIWT